MELIVYIHVHCAYTYNAFNYLHSSCKKVDVQVIYNYLYNQCISPLMLWSRIPMVRLTYCMKNTQSPLWVRMPLRRGELDTVLCDKVSQWLATGRWFSPGPPVSSTNKTEPHDITEILLKVAS